MSNVWDRIRNDDRLARVRKTLSLHELRIIIQHAQFRHDAALRAIIADPYGCPFCDSGKLRNPAKGHDSDCGFALADAVLTKTEAQS